MSQNLEWTGERYLPEISGVIKMEHYHRYSAVLDLCRGKVVLDLASGEGYGSHLISTVAEKVVGVDISIEAVKHASGKYIKDNLKFVVGSAAAIPFESSKFDHHDKHHESIAEFKRVLKPSGYLILSSPNKKNYTDVTGYNNPYHVKELYVDELKELIRKYFSNYELYGQKVLMGSLMYKPNGGSDLVFWKDGILKDRFNPVFDIIVASDFDVPNIKSGFYEIRHNSGLDHVQWVEEIDSKYNWMQKMYSADKDNYESQIRYRDELVAELRQQLQAEKNNAKAQIQFRDELVEEMRQQLQAEKNNAKAQIQFRDELVEEMRQQLQDEKENAMAKNLYRD
jgi:SAM-dependent methyltransferase